MNEKYDKYELEINESRKICRDVVYKIVLLSSAIVGFSVSLFSIDLFQDVIDVSLVKMSWYIFVTEIILGFFIMLLYGRIRYAKIWKTTNTLFTTDIPKKYKWYLKLITIPIALYSVLKPANMIFNHKKWMKNKKVDSINQLIVHELAWMEHRIPTFENIFFVLFIVGLVLLVRSVS